ncbi:ABC transporter ATP-binding protein [Nocardioides humi]|uniref:ABC transporter ATP-binding protein n=1 Tax=Nocardioides humi TaxID=449461 RepID=A0ABN1ZYG9_9ACTN|nr:ABC transporter ATP-binding protein [Nocardioides humi]
MTAETESATPPAVLAAAGLTVQYGSSTVAVRDLDLEVRPGEVVAILGSNGAGKTSLLRAFSGAVGTHGGRVVGGTIRHRGSSITGRSADERVRRGIVQVPEGRQVFGTLSVEENLRIGAYCKRLGRLEMHTRLDRAFDTFPVLGDRRRQLAGLLSGGEQQMLAIARAMMADPDVLLLDEPSLGLAPRIVDQVSQILEAINDAGTSMLIVEQNAHVALELADRAYVLAVGESVLDGFADELKASPEIQAAYLGGEIDADVRI